MTHFTPPASALLPGTSGYYAFLENRERRRRRTQRCVAELLSRELLGDELGDDEYSRTLMHAASHVLIVLEDDGWDVLLDGKGTSITGVVT